MTVRAYNPTASPVVIDRSGHTLAGGEWGEVNEGDYVGRNALKTQLLTEDGLHWQDDGSELETDDETPAPTPSRRTTRREKE